MPTQIGVGLSHHRNPKVAGQEAARKAMDQAGSTEVDFVLMFASVGYPQQRLVESVRTATGHAPLCGCSGEGTIAMGETDESNFSVSVMVFSSDELQFNHGLTSGLQADPAQTGNEVGQTVQPQLRPDTIALFLFADGLTFNFDRFLQGLETALEQPLPLFGGTSSDNWQLKRTYQYYNDQVMSDAVVWLLLSGQGRLAWAVNHGCLPIGSKRQITRCEHNAIYEIDGKPALAVLKEYLTEDEVDNWHKTVINLCLGLKAPSDLQTQYDEYLIRFIPAKNDELASIAIQTEVSEGTEIWMTRRDCAKIEAGVHRIGTAIADQLQGETPKCVFHFDCAGRGKAIFRDQQKLDLLNLLQSNIGTNVPWIGFYTYGEIGPVGSRNCFHNYTAVIAALY